MTTEQARLSFYLPPAMKSEFEALLKDEGKTVAGAIRVMVRDYIAAKKQEAAA